MNSTAAFASAHRAWGPPETTPFHVGEYVWLHITNTGDLAPHRAVGIVTGYIDDQHRWVRVGVTQHRRHVDNLRHSHIPEDTTPSLFRSRQRGPVPVRGAA